VTPNYAFAKRQRELAQKQKKEEKLKRKAGSNTPEQPADTAADSPPAPVVEKDTP
jgi:hypothetical protein